MLSECVVSVSSELLYHLSWFTVLVPCSSIVFSWGPNTPGRGGSLVYPWARCPVDGSGPWTALARVARGLCNLGWGLLSVWAGAVVSVWACVYRVYGCVCVSVEVCERVAVCVSLDLWVWEGRVSFESIRLNAFCTWYLIFSSFVVSLSISIIFFWNSLCFSFCSFWNSWSTSRQCNSAHDVSLVENTQCDSVS